MAAKVDTSLISTDIAHIAGMLRAMNRDNSEFKISVGTGVVDKTGSKAYACETSVNSHTIRIINIENYHYYIEVDNVPIDSFDLKTQINNLCLFNAVENSKLVVDFFRDNKNSTVEDFYRFMITIRESANTKGDILKKYSNNNNKIRRIFKKIGETDPDSINSNLLSELLGFSPLFKVANKTVGNAGKDISKIEIAKAKRKKINWEGFIPFNIGEASEVNTAIKYAVNASNCEVDSQEYNNNTKNFFGLLGTLNNDQVNAVFGGLSELSDNNKNITEVTNRYIELQERMQNNGKAIESEKDVPELVIKNNVSKQEIDNNVIQQKERAEESAIKSDISQQKIESNAEQLKIESGVSQQEVDSDMVQLAIDANKMHKSASMPNIANLEFKRPSTIARISSVSSGITMQDGRVDVVSQAEEIVCNDIELVNEGVVQQQGQLTIEQQKQIEKNKQFIALDIEQQEEVTIEQPIVEQQKQIVEEQKVQPVTDRPVVEQQERSVEEQRELTVSPTTSSIDENIGKAIDFVKNNDFESFVNLIAGMNGAEGISRSDQVAAFIDEVINVNDRLLNDVEYGEKSAEILNTFLDSYFADPDKYVMEENLISFATNAALKATSENISNANSTFTSATQNIAPTLNPNF